MHRVESFKQKIYEFNYNETETLQNQNETCKTFLQKFVTLYGNYFPEKKIKIKNKQLQSPWITSGIKIHSEAAIQRCS